MTRLQAQVIIALADHDLNIAEAARSLHYHRNTLVYHIDMIRDETGKDPNKFYDLSELLPIARAALAMNERR